jgi:LacI family transcriptional regulator, galactose operon repressor
MQGRRAAASRPTMREVAEAAGVSMMTVSRVVNGDARVAQPTRARVQAVIDALGYRRNDIARSLRPGHSSALLGLIITNVANPFYSVIALAVEQAARKRGFGLIVGNTDEDIDRERELVDELLIRRVDGLLIVPAGGDHSYLTVELAAGVKVVFLGRPPGRVHADVVLVDDYGGARDGGLHLIGKGHRRIGFVGNQQGVYTAARRLRGFRAALKQSGLTLPESLVRSGSQDVVAAQAAAEELLRLPDPPTALFASNNRNSIGALRGIRAVGRPVGLVGFDDFELADMIEDPFTVVAYDAEEMGRAATDLLVDRIQGDRAPPRRIVVPTRLVARGSSGTAGP